MRRFGSAMISNTDSMAFIYPIAHMRVKAYMDPKNTGTYLAFRQCQRIELRLRGLPGTSSALLVSAFPWGSVRRPKWLSRFAMRAPRSIPAST